MTRRYRGHAGHFICATRCLFHINTEVPGFRISSVGNFRPKLNLDGRDMAGPIEQIGTGYYYETMVFGIDAHGVEITPGIPVFARTYQNETDAEGGHEHLVRKYEAFTPDQIASEHAAQREHCRGGA